MLFDSVLCPILSVFVGSDIVFSRQTPTLRWPARTRTRKERTRMSFEIEELRTEPNAYKVGAEPINWC